MEAVNEPKWQTREEMRAWMEKYIRDHRDPNDSTFMDALMAATVDIVLDHEFPPLTFSPDSVIRQNGNLDQ